MPLHPPQFDQFLRSLHLGAEVYYVGQLCDAWHMSTPGGSDAATFHLLCHGNAWIRMPNQAAPVRMGAGDVAFFPHDAAHAFSGQAQIPDAPFDYSHPSPLNAAVPGDGLLCGHLKLPAHVRRLLLAAFPPFVLIRPAESPVGPALRDLIEQMSAEAGRNDLGAAAILDRMSDILFLYIIRHLLRLEPGLSPLFATLMDRPLHAAVAAFIDSPAEVWTVERLAQLACKSRSAFSQHFTQIAGMPPMEFVTLWRMQLATALLSSGGANMLDIAMQCGYESEAAFRKTFKRIVGVAPGQMRKPSAHG